MSRSIAWRQRADVAKEQSPLQPAEAELAINQRSMTGFVTTFWQSPRPPAIEIGELLVCFATWPRDDVTQSVAVMGAVAGGCVLVSGGMTE